MSTQTVAGTAPRGRGAVLVVMVALVLLTVAAYTPVWRFPFISIDDPQYVSANPHIAGGLSTESLTWAFTTGREANWHPLTWISHIVDVQLFGLNAGWHHLTSLLLHLGGTLLLFGVFRRMTGSIGRSAFVAAIFALHPLHVESVAWVAERKDVLSAFFFMLTLGAYVRYVEVPGRGRYLVVALCLALGLMAKAMLVTMPMVLLLVDFWPLGRVLRGPRAPQVLRVPRDQRSWGALVVEKAPLFALVAASSVVTFLVQRQGGAVKSLELFPFGLRLQNAIVSYVEYLRDVVWPVGLGVFYPFPASLSTGRVAVAAAILLAITAAAIRLVRRAPSVAVGWLWFVGILVPVMGLAQAGAQARADRFTYLPLIGLAMAAAWGAVDLARSAWQRRAVAWAGAAVVLACASATHAQVQYWRGTVALWSHTASVTDDTNNFGVYFSLGEYLRETSQPAEAIPRYESSIQRNPSYAAAHLGLGRALAETGQSERAATELAEAARLNPSSVEARMAFGIVLSDLGRATDAVVQLSEAVRMRPDVAEGHWRLALALAATGRLGDALPALAEAVRLDPKSAPIRNDYGWALAQHGQTAAAVAQLNEALRLTPDFVDAHHNLGGLLAAEGRIAEALTHLSEAVRLEPGFIDARLSLALTLIRAGRVDDGAKELREVLRLDPQNAAAARTLTAIGR